ncbi:MAG: leucine-rich repeat protein [Acutalibacteraceae bacterium]|nr:leucine-rich repeat protein [Acutalibacteraceae bacterium]
MIKTKRILSIILVMLTLFSYLSLNVFAEEIVVDRTVYTEESEAYIINNIVTGADTVYEKGKTYSINGVDYFIEETGTVTVKGAALIGVPEIVELLSELGEYKVTTIGLGAFYNSQTVKEVVVPETVTLIDRLAFEDSALTDIEIKGKNVHIKTDFDGTPMRHESEEHWSNDVFFVSGYAIRSYTSGDVVFGEDVVGIAENCFTYSGGAISEFTILNPDCYIPDVAGALPPNAVTYGYKGSTVHKYAENYGGGFLLICNCENTDFVSATNSYCNGTVGYGEGYWCENCDMYVSGGVVDTTFEHIDADGDNICDLCSLDTDADITTAGQCGDEAVWTLSTDGVLRITGTSSVYGYSSTNKEPWYAYKDNIKAFVAEKGVRGLSGISFKDYQKLETAYMADTVLSLPKSFENCMALKYFNIPKLVRGIGAFCFRKCTSLENVFIPKNVSEIEHSAFYKCTSLSDIDFELGYLSIGSNAFYGTAAYNNPDNFKDGFLYIDNCLIAEITPGTDTLVLGPEITSVASGWDATDSKVTEVVVYNYDCAFPNDTGALPGGAHFKAYVGSTAWLYSKKDFVPIEPHTHTEIIRIPAVAPTATEPGYTHVSYCAVCDEKMTSRTEISPLEYEITVEGDTVVALKYSAATDEGDGESVVMTFALRHDVYTSNVSQTVIYKVGEVKLSKSEFTYNGKVQKPTVTVKDSKGNKLSLNKDYKVTYSANSKCCGEYSVRVDYIGNYAGGKTLYYEIVIEAISPIVDSFTTESITLSWKQGHSDLVYRVYSVDHNGNLKKIDDTKNGSYEVTSLKSGTEYSFIVRAYVKDGAGKVYWGNEGDILSCSTKSDNTSNSMINFFKIFIERFKYILQILLMIK